MALKSFSPDQSAGRTGRGNGTCVVVAMIMSNNLAIDGFFGLLVFSFFFGEYHPL